MIATQISDTKMISSVAYLINTTMENKGTLIVYFRSVASRRRVY